MYYTNIAQLGEVMRDEILPVLRGVTFSVVHYHVCKDKVAMQRSMLRGLPSFSMERQLRRMALRRTHLENYRFLYILLGTELLE